ncbi:MAG: DNA-processing protein DprA [Bacilli bacterium]
MLKIRDILLYFSYKYKGDWQNIFDALQRKETVNEEEVNASIKKVGNNFITILDDDYPSKLKNIYRPPFVLYYKGDKLLLNADSMYISFIGSREASTYGEAVTRKLIEDINKENVIIVSGLAKGIDGMAHEAALDNQIKTIAVLGTGIDMVYPKENVYLYERIKEDGLIISEYPLSISPESSFPKRNRIIAGLSEKIVVCEAKKRSGTQITVNLGLEQGKDIYAVPTSIFEESLCNELIKDGAIPLLNGNELLQKN